MAHEVSTKCQGEGFYRLEPNPRGDAFYVCVIDNHGWRRTSYQGCSVEGWCPEPSAPQRRATHIVFSTPMPPTTLRSAHHRHRHRHRQTTWQTRRPWRQPRPRRRRCRRLTGRRRRRSSSFRCPTPRYTTTTISLVASWEWGSAKLDHLAAGGGDPCRGAWPRAWRSPQRSASVLPRRKQTAASLHHIPTHPHTTTYPQIPVRSASSSAAAVPRSRAFVTRPVRR